MVRPVERMHVQSPHHPSLQPKHIYLAKESGLGHIRLSGRS